MNLIIFFTIFNLLLFFLSKKIILIYNVYDYPDNKRKIHKSKTSLSGGFFIYLNLLALFIVYFLDNTVQANFNNFFGSFVNFLIFFTISTIFYIIGYLDDKLNFNANLKLLIFFILVMTLLSIDKGIIIHFVNFSFTEFTFSIGRYNFIFTLICFLLFINAFNMYDGINLQCGLYSLYLFLIFFIITDNIQLFFPVIISLMIFLYLNFKNKVFLGNSGSLFLSFFISYITIKIFNNNFELHSDQIFLLMILPGIDMLRLFFVRIINKNNPFKPDSQHLHHLLLNRYKYTKTILISSCLSFMPYLCSFLVDSYIVIILFLIIYLSLIFSFQKYN